MKEQQNRLEKPKQEFGLRQSRLRELGVEIQVLEEELGQAEGGESGTDDNIKVKARS